MLTRAKLKEGEGKLKTFNPEIGRATRRRKMEDEELHVESMRRIFTRLSTDVRHGRKIVCRLREESGKEGKEEES
jgi:hypothetical protein